MPRYLQQSERTIACAETQLGLTRGQSSAEDHHRQERLTAAALNRMLDEGARKARPAVPVVEEAEEWAAS